jgi:hypothetical protein
LSKFSFAKLGFFLVAGYAGEAVESISSLITMIEIMVVVIVVASMGAVVWFMRGATRRFEPTAPVYIPMPHLAPGHGAPAYPMVAAPTAPQIKKATCRTCGALKVQPPKTACMYCDYCGALVDWDYRVAMTTAGSAQPGQELRRLMAQEKEVQARARAAGDRAGYQASLVRVYTEHMRACPAAYSPRIGDPAFRSAVMTFLVAVDLDTGFDPACLAAEAALEQAIARLVRLPTVPPRIEPHSFYGLVAAKKASTARSLELMAPHLDKHPDRPTRELALAIINSSFVQYWLPFLDQPNQEWIIKELDLHGEYVPVTPVATTARHCGGCGGNLAVVQGASRVVCEACGRLNDVARPEIPCANCAGPVSLAADLPRFACPYCKADMRLDA